jgi:hypothetical protein
VIGRVLSLGTLRQVRALLRFYGRDRLRSFFREGGLGHPLVVGHHRLQIRDDSQGRSQMDRIERPKNPCVEDRCGVEQRVVETDQMDSSQYLAGSPQRRSPQMADRPRHLGAGKRAGDTTRMPAKKAPQSGRLSLAYHELHQGRGVEVDHVGRGRATARGRAFWRAALKPYPFRAVS